MTAQLPEPPVPANCDLTDFKFMPLLVARLRDSDLTSEQTPEENWAAVLLWAAAWHQVPAASLPDVNATIAKYAGYVAQGKVSPRWAKIKAGAMRGFHLCADGRWYHPVVAELANSAWLQKMQQRYDTEKSRIKQHNIRHGTKVPYPVWEEWFASGCVTGQPLPTTPTVTGDSPAPPPSVVTGDKVGTPPPPVTGDTPGLSPVTSTPRERERDRDRTPNTFPPAPSAPPPPTAAPTPAPTPKPTPKPRRTPAPTATPTDDEDRPTNRAWRAYAAAFAERYGVEPERNQQTNGQLARLLAKVAADDVPFVIDFYVRHKTTRYYLDRRHTIDDFVRDYHGIRTHWAQLKAGQTERAAEPSPTPSPRAVRMAGFAGAAAAGAQRQPTTPRPALGDVTDVESRDVKSSD